jgi:hypothetical protein
LLRDHLCLGQHIGGKVTRHVELAADGVETGEERL